MPETQEHFISDRALHIALRVLGCIGLVLLSTICYLELKP